MIYLDHSATTPVDKQVLAKMLPFFSDTFGNAASLHSLGQTAGKAVSDSRNIIAKHLNCSSDELIFTSGATESNNLAIKGLIYALGSENCHIISDMAEHQAVLSPIAQLEQSGSKISILGVGPDATVALDQLTDAIRVDTRLISIMYVNNEIGSVNNIQAIGDLIRRLNKDRGEHNKIFFHTDATQAMNFFSINVEELKVDLLSFSGHKIYGPKGIGALYVRKNTPLRAIISGGRQEKNLRSGTLNVPGIVGIGTAVEMLTHDQIQIHNSSIGTLRDALKNGLQNIMPDIQINTPDKLASPSHLNVSFPGISGESLLTALDLAGICVSTGSACSAKKASVSQVLVAMGIDLELAKSTIRFSLGKDTTSSEIDMTLSQCQNIISKLK